MSKKYLRKNEIRVDLNPNHFNKHGKPHKAIISAKYRHKLKANTITHAKYVNGVETYNLNDNEFKRISPPFWQNENQFGKEKLGKIPKRFKSKISRYNRKFKKK